MPNTNKLPPWKFDAVQFGIILGLAFGAALFPFAAFDIAQRVMLGIFVGAAGLWITAAIPPFATAILVIVLQIYLLGMPDGPFDLGAGFTEGYQIFLNPIASPVLVLFFGGFILAIGATKHGLDQRMAKALLSPFGQRPVFVLLGIILVTALFSMFMSNTATAAMMIAVVAPYFRGSSAGETFSKALILAVPFAANIGGIGTIISTPPNVVAGSVISGLGYPISFVHWMVIAVPIMLVLLFLLWGVLLMLFPPENQEMELKFAAPLAIGPRLIIVAGTFIVTVLLWITEPIHSIPAAIAALIPVATFTVTGVIDAQDLKRIDWDVLILVAGGLSLGVGMERTGLSAMLVDLVPFGALSLGLLMVTFMIVTVVVGTFMSNTSAANLLIPIAVAISVWSPPVAALTVAFGAALGMSLPVSTPPNAIAFATGKIKTREMATAGLTVSLIGALLIVLYLYLLHRFTPLL